MSPHALAPMAFTQSSIDYLAILPMLLVFGGALVGVLIEAFVPRAQRYLAQLVTAVLVLVGALVVVLAVSVNHRGTTLGLPGIGGAVKGSVSIDGPAIFMQASLLLLSLLGLLVMAERLGGAGTDAFTPMGASTPGSPQEAAAQRAGMATTEVFPLTLFSVGGMMLFVSANDLLTMFVALEVLSLPLYVLAGLARRRRLLSQEASLKYFLLGAFSSAFFLFGAALLFGYAGSIFLPDITTAIGSPSAGTNGLLVPGILMVFVGLLFKVGAVPFHAWTPDVYQGAPTPVSGFMAACTKTAAFGAIIRFAYAGVEAARWEWRLALILVALATMIVGAILSVTQTDMKRLLAYSSIAHAGFVLVGVLSLQQIGVAGVMFYVLAYGLATIAAFGIVGLVRDSASGSEASRLSQWAGLGRKHPVTAAVFCFLLLAFAGVPLTSGFTSKFAVFAPAIASGTSGVVLVVAGVLCSAITVFVYLRVIVLMYFTEAPDDDTVAVVTPSMLTTFSVGLGAALTLVLGVAPGKLIELANSASLFIR